MAAATVRHPAVAGRFYPNDADDLREEVRGYLSQTPETQTPETQTPDRKPVCAVGCIVPHAGYMYSGHVAGAVFAGLEIPHICLVLCPNHTGVGRALAIMSEGAWETPLGTVAIDNSFATCLFMSPEATSAITCRSRGVSRAYRSRSLPICAISCRRLWST